MADFVVNQGEFDGMLKSLGTKQTTKEVIVSKIILSYRHMDGLFASLPDNKKL